MVKDFNNAPGLLNSSPKQDFNQDEEEQNKVVAPAKEKPKKKTTKAADKPSQEKKTTVNGREKKAEKWGRPFADESKGKKKDYCKTINIAVDKELLEKVNDYSLVARGVNLTEYINLLIENDMKKNLEKYKETIKSTKFD